MVALVVIGRAWLSGEMGSNKKTAARNNKTHFVDGNNSSCCVVALEIGSSGTEIVISASTQPSCRCLTSTHCDFTHNQEGNTNKNTKQSLCIGSLRLIMQIHDTLRRTGDNLNDNL